MQVAIYDVAKENIVWRTEGSHTETIFDCAFSTKDANILATCSYDGTVRIWDVKTLKCLRILTGANEALHSLCWSPDDENIAASDSAGRVHMYDSRRGLLMRSLQMHSRNAQSCRSVDTQAECLQKSKMEYMLFWQV